MAFSSEIEKLERRWQENPLGLTFAPLAEAYRKAGDTARALELLEQGLTQHPNYVPAHIVRGRCHLDGQSDSDAELAFLRVTELDPENVIALKSLAELSERAGRIPEAVHRLGLLLDVDRNNEEARGQLDRVRDLLTVAAAPAPATPEAAPWAPPPAPEPAPVAFGPVDSPAEIIPAMPPEAAPDYEAGPTGTFDESSLGDLELETATQLTSAPSDDYQIPNDSESLQATGEGIEDIVLGTEPPGDFPIDQDAYGSSIAPESPAAAGAAMDSVDVLLGEDYAALMAYRDVSTVPAVEPPAVEETVFAQMALIDEPPPPAVDVMPPPPAAPFEQESVLPPPLAEPASEPAPDPISMMESEEARSVWAQAPSPEPPPATDELVPREPESVAEAEPEPEPELEPAAVAEAESLVAEPALEPEPVGMVDDYVPLGDLGEPTPYQPAAPQGAEESEPASAAEPELVVTETMAEIFLRQGHRELALAVYAQLAQREPGNERIAEAVARLTPEAPVASEPAPEPAPRFAATETGGRSVGELFGSLLSASRPNVAQTIHPPAFELPRRVSGEPTRPAQESLSLSSVFGEESAAPGPAGTAADSGVGEPSFDEFFAPATSPAADVELPRTPESDPAGAAAQVPEDLEQFNAWLRGLKR